MTKITLNALGPYNKAQAFGLGRFYQRHTGNLIIDPDEFTPEVQAQAMAFIRKYPEYILGFENFGNVKYYYITTADDFFANW